MADPIPGAPSPSPRFALPQPNYQPLPGIDPSMAMLLAPLLQSMTGGKFLPQQFPAQGMFDQMMSAKYQSATRANFAKAQETDQAVILQSMKNMRSDRGVNMSPLETAQLNTFASIANSQPAQMITGMLMGEQNAEDLFFGRRGSAVRLAESVNKIGFSRADSVTGKDSMSAKSLEQFSQDVYSNLYGAGKDLNDVSGFSAGRVGNIMTDLAERGLLPASMSKLNAGQRKKAFDDAGGRSMTFSEDATEDTAIKNAMGSGADVDEVAKLSGGADAVRKVDATRVSNSIKGYTEALSSVRQIFGDSGMSNAPMQQLLAAMEALTQNSMSAMSPGKIENLMRRTQMASRDSGVSLEVLMGLSARSGAIADHYGLSREIAANSVVTSMEAGGAMQDTGSFTPGFDRLDKNAATLAVLDETQRADASPVGKLFAVAGRLAAEAGPKSKFQDSNMGKMVAALKRGEGTYYDTTEKRDVDIYKEFGRDPDKIMRRLLGESGTSTAQFGALYRDRNTQEFAIPGAARNTMPESLKTEIAGHLSAQESVLGIIGGGLNPDQKTSLGQHIGRGLSTALVDNVNHTMKAPDRLKVLRRAFEQSAVTFAREQLGSGASVDDVMKRAGDISKVGANNIMGFKTEEQLNAFLSVQQAEAGALTEAKGFGPLEQLRQRLNDETMRNTQARSRKNVVLAGFPTTLGADGSNVIQRFSDVVAGRPGAGTGTAFENILGLVDDKSMREEIIKSAAGGEPALIAAFDNLKTTYAAGTVDTEEEKAALEEQLAKDKNITAVQGMFAGTAAEGLLSGKTAYMSDQEVANKLMADTKAAEHLGAVKAAYNAAHSELDPNAVDKIFANPNSAESKAAYLEVAKSVPMRAALPGVFEDAGVGSDVLTQNEFHTVNRAHDAFGAGTNHSQVKAIGKLGAQLDTGDVTGDTLLAAYGVDVTDPKNGQQKAIKDTLDKFMVSGGSFEEVTKAMTAGSATPEQIQNVQNMAQMSRKINAIDGLSKQGAAGFQARAEISAREVAFERAATAGELTGEIAEIAKKEKGTRSPDEQQKYDAALKDDAAFKKTLGDAGVDGDGKARKDVEQEAERLTKEATGATDPTGIGAAVASAISGSLGKVFQDAIAGLAKSSAATGPFVLEGEISLKNLESAMANLLAKPKVESTGGSSPPVMA